MALDSKVLASEIETKLIAAGFTMNGFNKPFFTAISEAVVEHIQKDAVVTTSTSTGIGTVK